MKNSLVHLKVPVPALLAPIFLWPILRANVALAVADSLADAVRTTISEQAKLTPSDGAAGDYFGYSVSLSGNRALVGAFRHDDNGADSGAA